MQNDVSDRQIFFIIYLTLTGYGVVELPKTMAESAGTGAWLVLLLTAVFFSFVVAVLTYLGNLFKGKTLFEYSNLLVGKLVTYCFALIYMLYFFGVLSMMLRSVAEIIKVDILIKTPIWATMLVLLFFSANAVREGISNVGRIYEFLGLIIIISIFILFPVMFFSGDRLNVLPLFDLKDMNAYIKALPLSIMPFLGSEVITTISFSKSNGKKTVWYAMSAVLLAGVVYALLVEFCYMVLGVADAQNYKDAYFVAVRMLDIDRLQFLKRLDIIAIVTWVFSIFCSITILLYTVHQYTSKIFVKLKGYKGLIIVSVLAYIASMIPKSYDMTAQIFTYLTMYFGLVPALIIPLILLIVAKVKKYEKKNA